jgi:polar amino acid transport system substrate-binding protein
MRILHKTVCFCLTIIFAGTSAAYGNCSRTMKVPLAATGLSVIVSGENISGVYPEILSDLSAKEKCNFELSVVPRARLEMMFENGYADILIPATRTSRRDKLGFFIPLVSNRAMLISVQEQSIPVKNFKELLEQKTAKIAVVRGFDYGEKYQAFLKELQKRNRLRFEADPVSVARLLKSGAADYTLMAPSIFAGSVQIDERVTDLEDKLQYQPLQELNWGESGVYFSKKSLSTADVQALQEIFERAASDGLIWKGFQRYYKKEFLKDSVRPRDTLRSSGQIPD